MQVKLERRLYSSNMADYVKELRKLTKHMTLLLAHSVVVVLNDKNEVLLEERSDDGYFDFPGGALDLEETLEEAAARELLEETGIIADELELLKVYSGEITHYTYFNGDEIYGVDAVYICKKYHGELNPQLSEVKRLFYCPLNQMPDKMSKRNKQIIVDLLKKNSEQ